MARKPTELRPLMVRIPESLRRRLEKEAAKQDRSMNAEIIHRLDQSFSLPALAKATANATAVLEKFTVVAFEGASRPIGQTPSEIGTGARDEEEQS
jgi:Arc-like DNA binding dprotein